MSKRLWSTGVIAVVVMILVGACSTGSATPTPAASGPAASATAKPPAAVPSVPTGYTELDQSLANPPAFKGKTVTIQTQWVGGEGIAFAASVADFAAASGIKIQIDSIGSSNETVLKTRIQGGNPPDLAQLAQPTPVLAYGAAGSLVDVGTIMDANKLTTEHPSIALITVNGKIWGIPYKQDVKSAIWYPQKAFKAAGYTVPTTWDDLIKLSDKIIADGKGNPWCVSAGGPGDATGWQITDWVEEVILKTKGVDYYKQWINHEVPFTDQGVKDAFDKYVGHIFFTDKYVYGGYQAIVNTDQKTPMDPMFNPGNGDMSAPKCWMQKIPFWYGPDFFPDRRASGGTAPSVYTIGADGDVAIMPFPTIDPAQKNVEVSGDTFIVLKDRPEVRAVAQFLSTPQGIENWVRDPGVTSSNSTTPKEWYAGNYKLSVSADIVGSGAATFDASDLMPAAVGSGAFWTQSIAWTNAGGTNTDTILAAIDAAWPAAGASPSP